MTIKPFIDLEEDSDFDPQSRDYFTDFAQLPKPTTSLNALRIGTINDMCRIGEDAMVSPKMLVARRRHLDGLRVRVVGSSSGTQSHNNDSLSFEPNVARARANHISALGGQFNDFILHHNTRSQNMRHCAEDIREGVEVGNVDGMCFQRPVKNGNWTNDQLEATFSQLMMGSYTNSGTNLWNTHLVFAGPCYKENICRRRGK